MRFDCCSRKSILVLDGLTKNLYQGFKKKKKKIPGLWRFFHAYNQVFKAFSTG